MTSIELNASVIRDITTIMDDESLMTKLQSYIKTLIAEREEAKRLASKKKFMKQLKREITDALQEVEDAKLSGTELMTMDELYAELEKDN